jgi:hypothetical protein
VNYYGYQIKPPAETSLLDDRQLAHEREVIRRQTRERRAMDAELGGMQGGVHENVIDGEGGEAGGERTECPCRPDKRSHVTQVPGNEPMGVRGPHTVEISE